MGDRLDPDVVRLARHPRLAHLPAGDRRHIARLRGEWGMVLTFPEGVSPAEGA